MDLKIEINEGEIKRKASELANKQAQEVAVSLVNIHFRPSNEHFRHAKGIGYQIIEKHVDDILTSETLAAKIQKIVDDNMDKIIEEATLEAMRHKAKKIAFEKVNTKV